MPIAVCGDGDFMMGNTAVWTAAHYRIPLLIVVTNNRSFFNDELHQERVARARNRPVENRWIGQRIDHPAPDLAKIAVTMGDVEGAISALERLLLVEGDQPEVKLELGVLYYRLGAVDVARAYLEQARDSELSTDDVRQRANTYLSSEMKR